MYDIITSIILILIGIAVIYGLCFLIVLLISTSYYYCKWLSGQRRLNREKAADKQGS